MSELTVQDKGYVVIYDTSTKGEIGFIGIDDHSGGYPYFSRSVDYRRVRKTLAHAQDDLKSAMKMTTYYGRDKVHFGTMRVARYSHVFAEVDENDDKIFFEQTIKKLTDAELDVIKRHLKEESK